MIDHWMTFATFREQDYFVYPNKDTYRGVILNGNIVAHAPAGLAGFLNEKTNNLPYIIDPITHAFQHDPYFVQNKDSELKKSFRVLSSSFGSVISDKAGKEPVMPTDFDEASINELVDGCLEFQRSYLSEAMMNAESAKYLDLHDGQAEPYAFIAPYFYMTEASIDRWLELNIELAQVSKNKYPQHKVFAEIVIGKGIVSDSDLIAEIVEKYTSSNVDGYMIWVDDLNEHAATSLELTGLLSLARHLSDGGREVINLHGGYFSVLCAGTLGDNAFKGVAHGPEFGEHRSVIPVGGGIPVAKYYVPILHAREKYKDALSMFLKKGWLEDANVFHENVCDCRECIKTIEGDANNFAKFGDSIFTSVKRKHGVVRMQYPKTETKERCLRHYLERKAVEYESASTKQPGDLLSELEEGIERLEPIIGMEGVKHLVLWNRVLGRYH